MRQGTGDPNTAPIVPRIFYDYANGKPLKEIADELNSQGIPDLTVFMDMSTEKVNNWDSLFFAENP
ncbi:MAG: recombinase family protein [Eubacteriales bacterium]